ncbi:MAG: outer membrane protein [Xenococcus sp. (in: cyanobacteria)]
MNKFLSISFAIIGSLFIATPLLAQAKTESEISEPATKTATEKSKDPKWEVDIQPTLLIPLNLDGGVGVEIDEDEDGSDEGGGSGVIEIPIAVGGDSEFNFDEALRLSGRVEAWHRKGLGLIFDGAYTRYGESGFVAADIGIRDRDPFFRIEVPTDILVQQGIFVLAAGYEVIESELGRRKSPDKPGYPILRFRPFLGTRFTFIDIGVDFEGISDIDIDDSFFDLMVGASLDFQVSRKWNFGVRADYSGFGIGDSTDSTVTVVAGAEWSVSKLVALRLKYRFYEIDFDRESKILEDNYTINFEEQGAWLGVSFRL